MVDTMGKWLQSRPIISQLVLSQTFGIFRLLADFATWFSNKQQGVSDVG
jgi:hypothetical protein